MKRNLLLGIVVICVLGFNMLALAEEEHHVVHVPVDVDFETALDLFQSAYSQESGVPLDEVKKMEFAWSASPRYLVISAEDQYWKRSDANWYEYCLKMGGSMR